MTILLAIVGVLGISASGPIIAAFPTVPVLSMALWRNGSAAVLLAAPALRKNRRIFREMTRREWSIVVASGVALALHFVCFMYAVRMTSVAAATALVCIQGVWIALFQMYRGVRYQPIVLIGMGLAICGVVAITGLDLGLGREALIGDLLAIMGGMLAAAYTLAGSAARRTLGTGTYASTCYAVTAVILLVLCLVTGQPLWGFDTLGWIGIILLTVCAQLLGHTVMNHLLKVLGALTVSTLILLEIPGAALLAALFLEQVVPWGTFVGLGAILIGLWCVVRGQSRLVSG
ncbi:DMT family transporter [Glutamicibacter endophyticus]|uniref:DMT family transporter n=1 Tax=Glutamicibacter sp. PS TaxID=3075634 RepID=UPI00283B7C19|nr:DMT family transporter [Glutamicibacter sp. PS]MDR4534903.1 DMT family transporter [Glutamicibacter sp. PS]